MSAEQQSIDAQTIEETKQQIRSLIAEITTLSRQDLDPQVFYSEFLQRIIVALAAAGGAIWMLRKGNELALSAYINLRQVFPEGENNDEDQARHSRLLYRILRSGDHLLVPPYSGTAGDDEAGNPTNYLLVLAPIRDDEKVAGVIEVFQRPTSNPASQRGYLTFLAEMAQHFGQFLRSRRLRELADWQSLFSEVDRFSKTVHESLDPKTTAYTIANEGRRLIGCDRVSVAVKKGNKCIVEAVSGQDTMDTRANSVVLLGKLATAVVRSGEPLWYTGSSEDLPPQIETAVHDYVDETHTKTVAVLPLKRIADDTTDTDDARQRRLKQQDRVVGALILEQIEDSRPASDFSQSVDLVCQHSARALANASEHHGVFLMPLWKTLGKAKWLVTARTLPKTLAVLAAVLAVTLSMWLVRWDFRMQAKGKVQPRIRKAVFADVDGTVRKVHVKHGDHVKKGDLLVELDNPDIIQELNRLTGELEIKRRESQAYNRQLQRPSLDESDRKNMEMEKIRIDEAVRTLEHQHKLRSQQVERLSIHSPIDGSVVSWDIDRLLTGRPVARGNLLLSVYDTSGPWELEIYMEEDRMGHVYRHLPKDPQEPVDVTYIITSNPSQKLHGKLYQNKIHRLAQLHDEYGHSVRLIVDVNKDDFQLEPGDSGTTKANADGKERVPPGTEVSAKIDCGRASIGYVWFHELIEFFQSRVFF